MRTWRRGRSATRPTRPSPGRQGHGPGTAHGGDRGRVQARPWRTCRPAGRRARDVDLGPAPHPLVPVDHRGGRPRLRPAPGGRRPVHRGRRRRRPNASTGPSWRMIAALLRPTRGRRRRRACTRAGSRRTRPRRGTTTWWSCGGTASTCRSRCPGHRRRRRVEARWLASASRSAGPRRWSRCCAWRRTSGAWWVPFPGRRGAPSCSAWPAGCATRRSVLAATAGAVVGWALSLWAMALSSLPVGATARAIAALAGLPPYAAVAVAVTLLLAGPAGAGRRLAGPRGFPRTAVSGKRRARPGSGAIPRREYWSGVTAGRR